jgi:hypothetical protein
MKHVIYRCKCGAYYANDKIKGLRPIGEDVAFACRLAGATLLDASACKKCHPQNRADLSFRKPA